MREYNAATTASKANFTYDEMFKVANGDFNKGEILLGNDGKLVTINSHVKATSWNDIVSTKEQNRAVREAIGNALRNKYDEESGNPGSCQTAANKVANFLIEESNRDLPLSRDELRKLLQICSADYRRRNSSPDEGAQIDKELAIIREFGIVKRSGDKSDLTRFVDGTVKGTLGNKTMLGTDIASWVKGLSVKNVDKEKVVMDRSANQSLLAAMAEVASDDMLANAVNITEPIYDCCQEMLPGVVKCFEEAAANSLLPAVRKGKVPDKAACLHFLRLADQKVTAELRRKWKEVSKREVDIPRVWVSTMKSQAFVTMITKNPMLFRTLCFDYNGSAVKFIDTLNDVARRLSELQDGKELIINGIEELAEVEPDEAEDLVSMANDLRQVLVLQRGHVFVSKPEKDAVAEMLQMGSIENAENAEMKSHLAIVDVVNCLLCSDNPKANAILTDYFQQLGQQFLNGALRADRTGDSLYVSVLGEDLDKWFLRCAQNRALNKALGTNANQPEWVMGSEKEDKRLAERVLQMRNEKSDEKEQTDQYLFARGIGDDRPVELPARLKAAVLSDKKLLSLVRTTIALPVKKLNEQRQNLSTNAIKAFSRIAKEIDERIDAHLIKAGDLSSELKTDYVKLAVQMYLHNNPSVKNVLLDDKQVNSVVEGAKPEKKQAYEEIREALREIKGEKSQDKKDANPDVNKIEPQPEKSGEVNVNNVINVDEINTSDKGNVDKSNVDKERKELKEKLAGRVAFYFDVESFLRSYDPDAVKQLNFLLPLVLQSGGKMAEIFAGCLMNMMPQAVETVKATGGFGADRQKNFAAIWKGLGLEGPVPTIPKDGGALEMKNFSEAFMKALADRVSKDIADAMGGEKAVKDLSGDFKKYLYPASSRERQNVIVALNNKMKGVSPTFNFCHDFLGPYFHNLGTVVGLHYRDILSCHKDPSHSLAKAKLFWNPNDGALSEAEHKADNLLKELKDILKLNYNPNGRFGNLSFWMNGRKLDQSKPGDFMKSFVGEDLSPRQSVAIVRHLCQNISNTFMLAQNLGARDIRVTIGKKMPTGDVKVTFAYPVYGSRSVSRSMMGKYSARNSQDSHDTFVHEVIIHADGSYNIQPNKVIKAPSRLTPAQQKSYDGIRKGKNVQAGSVQYNVAEDGETIRCRYSEGGRFRQVAIDKSGNCQAIGGERTYTEAQKETLSGSRHNLHNTKTGEKLPLEFANVEFAPDGVTVLCEVPVPGQKPKRAAILENGVFVSRSVYDKGLRPTVKQRDAAKGLGSETLVKTLKVKGLSNGEKLTLSQDCYAGPGGSSVQYDVLRGGNRVGAVRIEPNGTVRAVDPVADFTRGGKEISEGVRNVIKGDQALQDALRNNPAGAAQLYNALAKATWSGGSVQQLFAGNKAFRRRIVKSLQDGCAHPLPVGKFSVPFSSQAQVNFGSDIHRMLDSIDEKKYAQQLSDFFGDEKRHLFRIRINGGKPIDLGDLKEETFDKELFSKIGVSDEASKAKVLSLIHQNVLFNVSMGSPNMIEDLSLPKGTGCANLSSDKPSDINFITDGKGGLRCEYDINMKVSQLGLEAMSDLPQISYDYKSSDMHLGFGFDLRRPGGSAKLQTENFAAIGDSVEFDLALHGKQS